MRIWSLGPGDPPWRRKWQLTPVFLPGKFQAQRSLVGYSPWGCKRVRYDFVTKQRPACHRDWHGNSTQKLVVLFPLENFHGQKSLAGYSPWGYRESDMTEHACIPLSSSDTHTLHPPPHTHTYTHTHTHTHTLTIVLPVKDNGPKQVQTPLGKQTKKVK